MNATAPISNTADDYLATLGLQQHPYLDSTNARFFYADPGLIQRLDLLQHLTQFGDMLLGVTGAVGSGKSTLAQQFLLRSNSTSWRSCHLNGAQLQQPAELLAKLAEGFGLHTTCHTGTSKSRSGPTLPIPATKCAAAGGRHRRRPTPTRPRTQRPVGVGR